MTRASQDRRLKFELSTLSIASAILLSLTSPRVLAQSSIRSGSVRSTAPSHVQKPQRPQGLTQLPTQTAVQRQVRSAPAVRPRDPVTGEPIDPSVFVTTQEGPLYFSSQRCVGTFTANPDRFAEQARAQREALANLLPIQAQYPALPGVPATGVGSLPRNGKGFLSAVGTWRPEVGSILAGIRAQYRASFAREILDSMDLRAINSTWVKRPANGRQALSCDRIVIGASQAPSARYANTPGVQNSGPKAGFAASTSAPERMASQAGHVHGQPPATSSRPARARP